MPVDFAKHTETKCASAPKCATCTHVRLFFPRPPSTKICWQVFGLFIFVGRHAPVSQSYPWQLSSY